MNFRLPSLLEVDVQTVLDLSHYFENKKIKHDNLEMVLENLKILKDNRSYTRCGQYALFLCNPEAGDEKERLSRIIFSTHVDIFKNWRTHQEIAEKVAQALLNLQKFAYALLGDDE